MKNKELMKRCKDLQLLLTDGDSTDINGIYMADELKCLTSMINSKLSPLDLLKFIVDIKEHALNVSIALRILLTLYL